jgi:hypothetical protein
VIKPADLEEFLQIGIVLKQVLLDAKPGGLPRQGA